MASGDRPVGLGQPGRDRPASNRNTMPPPPLARPSAPLVSEQDEEILELPDPDEDGWIPVARGTGEDTSLLDLDSADVEEIPSAASRRDGDLAAVEDEPSFWPLRHALGDGTLDRLEQRGLPAALVRLAGKTRHVHWIGAAAVLTGLFVLVLVLALSGGETPGPTPAPALIGSGPPQKAVSGVTPPTATGQGAEKPAGVVETPSAPPPVAAPVVPAPGRNCRPLSEYPGFPWRDRLAAALDAAGASSICGLLGAKPEVVVRSAGDRKRIGPAGYDLLPGVEMVEVFVPDKPDRRSPAMRYLFAGGALGEIQLDYRDSVSTGPDFDDLVTSLDVAPETLTDHLGRKITRFADGDLLVEQWEEKWYGRTLRRLVFAGRGFREAFESGREARENAEKLVAEGEGLLGRRKHEEALAAFVKAAEATPGYGTALLRQALALMRLEKFDELVPAANRVLAESREASVRADARGLLGVAALFARDKAAALAHYKAAAEEDPVNPLFAISVKELETGEHDMSRVALTAARMECRQKGKIDGSVEALLARGNFADSSAYFKALGKAQKNGRWNATRKQYIQMECR